MTTVIVSSRQPLHTFCGVLGGPSWAYCRAPDWKNFRILQLTSARWSQGAHVNQSEEVIMNRTDSEIERYVRKSFSGARS
jgi:hypothetical protein